MKAVKLRKKERASLLLLRIPVLPAASNTSPHARLRLGMCVLAVVVSPRMAYFQKDKICEKSLGNRSKIDFFFPNRWSTVCRLLAAFLSDVDYRRPNASHRAPHRGASGNTWTDVGCAISCPRCCFLSFLAAAILPMVQLRARSCVSLLMRLSSGAR